MGKAKTDPDTERRIMELHSNGLSLERIGKRLGLSKSTVRNVVKRNAEMHTHAPATTEASIPGGTAEGTDTGTGRNGMDPYLTQENTAAEIVEYVRFFKSRTRHCPYDLGERDKAWAEANYGKRWAEGIHMMVDATGLSAEVLLSSVDDCQKDMLESLKRFNAKFRTGEGAE